MARQLEYARAAILRRFAPRPAGSGLGWHSRDPLADAACVVGMICAGALIHLQIEANALLLAALRSGVSPLSWLVVAGWGLGTATHLYRRRGHRIVLLTGPALLAPALVQLPILYLCSEGHCV